jgi:hypothetical protein
MADHNMDDQGMDSEVGTNTHATDPLLHLLTQKQVLVLTQHELIPQSQPEQ